jgi:hypothetical protein
LATTDSEFPLQLWDRLTPQVQDTLNMMRASRIKPEISAYEALNRPYDWNRYPLAPLGCKAVVYEDGDTRGLWATRGIDAWYLGPSQDHYRCNLYYIPETRAYRISGLAKLFPQHCQLPDMTPHQHLHELTNKLNDTAIRVIGTTKGRRLLKKLEEGITKLLAETPTMEEQRVRTQAIREEEQRVIDESPILTIPRITDAPNIMQSQNPTAKRTVKNTVRLHRRVTRDNTPGIVPAPTLIAPVLPKFPRRRVIEDNPPRRSKRIAIPAKPLQTYTAIPRGAQQ